MRFQVRLRLVLVAVLLLDGVSAPAAVRRLTGGGRFQDSLSINRAGQAVWRGSDGSDYEVFFWDGARVRRLTDDSTDEISVGLNHRGQVVWLTSPEASGEIVLWDGGSVRQLTGPGQRGLAPQLTNTGQVFWLWYLWRGQRLEYSVYRWDGAETRRLFTLPETPASIAGWRVNDRGQMVWASVHPISHWQVYFWDGSAVRQLTPDTLGGYDPDLNGAGQVVWQSGQGNETEIYLWDGTAIRRLTQDNVYDFRPRIGDGGQVVWESTTLRLWNGTTVQPLPPQALSAFYGGAPRLNASGQVVWAGLGERAPEIHLWTGANVQQLTDNRSQDAYPEINDAGEVAWIGIDEGQTGSDIYLYTPPHLQSVDLHPASVVGGRTAFGTVVLTEPAPKGGVIVPLASSDPQVASVPTSVTVAAGATTARFPIQTSWVPHSTRALITADTGGVRRTVALTVSRRRTPSLGARRRPG